MHRISYVAVCLLACGSDVRQGLEHLVTRCTGGVNQQTDLATPDQCEVARNVWAPDGKVVVRPGYEGLFMPFGGDTTQTLLLARSEDTSAGTFASPSGAGVLSLTGLAALAGGETGDRLYIGYASQFTTFRLDVTQANANATRASCEYWNGSTWKPLHYVLLSSHSLQATFLGGNYRFSFVAPQDWATTTVDSQSAYWLRFHFRDADLDGVNVEIDVDSTGTTIQGAADIRGIVVAQFPSTKRYTYLVHNPTSGTGQYFNYLSGDSIVGHIGHVWAPTPYAGLNEPPTSATVPQFNESFIAYDHIVTRFTGGMQFASNSQAVATVESSDFAIGDDAPYDDAYIAQLSECPRAKYISFFKGRLWAANLLNEPYTVRWGGPQPYHKVWPQLSYEVLAEHDNSPITGMHPLGEFMVIFKQDSIWMAYDSGLDAFGLQTYAIRQVVAGTGCVANSSIKAIRGNLIFLAEDGIYRFDGAGVEKISDPIGTTIADISPGRRPFSAAAHWKTNSLYLLSVSTGGSANDTTIVYDYDNGTWWIWDNIDAQHWLEDEGQYDEETLYFGDSQGRIYRMGGQTDHGAAIDVEIKTQRLSLQDGWRQRVRQVELKCSNKTQTAAVEVIMNDERSGTSATVSFVDSAEPTWSDFSYNSGATTDDNWTPLRRRIKRVAYRKDFDWVQVKVTHSVKYQPFELSYIDVGVKPIGRGRQT
jgi:hypothetical protein